MTTWIMTAALKGGAMLVLALVAARMLRRQPASVRHSVWLAAILSQLLIPVLGAALPAWRLVLPARLTIGVERTTRAVVVAPSVAPSDAPRPTIDPSLSNAPGLTTAPTGAGVAGTSAVVGSPVRSWATMGFYVWAAGVGAVLLWLAAGTVGVALVARRAARVTDGDWLSLATEISDDLGLRRPVVLLRGQGLSVPVTWGILVPVVLLPTEADAWSADRRRTVLLHELAHVRRLDALSQLVAHVVLALCWFDPLVWVGVRALRSESEKACDDCVIRHGTEPSAYVTDLLSIVRAARPTRVPAMAALAMARPTEFEGRVLAILDAGTRRSAVGRAAQLATAVAALALVAPLAAMQPADAPPSAPSTAAGDPALSHGDETQTPAMPTPTAHVARSSAIAAPAAAASPHAAALAQPPAYVMPAPAPTPTPTPTPNVDGWNGKGPRVKVRVDSKVNVRVGNANVNVNANASGNPAAVMPLVNALRDTDAGVRNSAVHALGELEDPRAVDALIAALAGDTDAKVRETAAWALGQIEDHKAVPGLLGALQRDQSPAVRKQAAWALGQIEDGASVAGLGAALRDDSPEVRRMAMWALGQIDDPRAVPFLMPALTNADAEVRKQAAWALGQIESKDATTPLSAALRDSDARVRETAAWALGQIEDPRAVPALAATLRDATPSVRKNAAWALGQIESREGVSALVGALDDSDREVRKTAAWALGQIEDPAAVNGLAALTRSGDPDLRRAAVHALSKIGGAGAVEALVALLKDPDPEVRRAAVSALGHR